MSEKFRNSDFEMIRVRTPLGHPALISKTAFDQEKEETEKKQNIWSPVKSPSNSPKMESKNEIVKRPISRHILSVLEPHINLTFDLKQIIKLLKDAGWNHSRGMIIDNLNILIKQGKIIKTDAGYGILSGEY